MSRTYVPEEDTRVADLAELKNLYPTSHRVVFVESKDNFYWWEPGGEATNADGDRLVASDVSGFQDGDANEGLWHLSASNIADNTTDDLAEGSTNLYFTEQRARNSLSASGDLNYDPNTGEFSVQSVVNTDELNEGSTNLFFTNERVDDRVDNLIVPGLNLTSTYNDNTDSLILNVDNNLSSYNVDITTDELTEGSTNLFYTQNRFDTDFDNKTTDDLGEGSTNLYYSNTRVKNDFRAGGDISYKKSPKIGTFDLSNASFSGKSFSINEGNNNSALAFNGDGSKMFVTGIINGDVYEYNLSTGFDVSTASFSNTSLDVSSEEGSPTGVQFNDDGSKMFVIGTGSTSVHEYDLSTGFDLSTASYSGTSFDVNSEDFDPTGVQFNDDGSKMFVVGNSSDSLHEYDLSTGFDLSTASFSGTSFDVSSEVGTPKGVAFNGDGSKMFVISDTPENIYEYDLSTGFDLSTASFSGTSFDVSSEANGPSGVQFNDDGSKMFVLDFDIESVHEYSVGSVGEKAEFSLDVSSLSASDLFGTKTTDDLSEGSINLYFTDERVDDRVNNLIVPGLNLTSTYNDNTDSLILDVDNDLSSYNVDITTDDLPEGSSNLYFTEQRARNSVSASGDLNYDPNTGVFSISSLDLSQKTTDDLAEGSSNLYFTGERVDDRVNTLLEAGNAVSLTYDDQNDTLTIAGQQVTAENIQDDAWDVLTGTQTLINVTYDDANDEVDFIVESNLSQYTNDAGFITDLTSFTTDNLLEGSSNLYYTDARVDNEINRVRPAGQDTFSGDGSIKTFDISHGLGVTPDAWLVSPGTDDASGISHTTATDTTLTVHYDSAPPSGTGNIVINWFVDSVGSNLAPLWENQDDVTYEK